MKEISRPLSHAARFARGSLPPAWLRGMDAATLTLTRVSGPFSVMDGLVEEARETARRLVEPGNRSSVRGGPWCRIALTTNDLIEVEAVAQCTNRQHVKGLVNIRDSRTGSLADHLAQRRYRGGEVLLEGAKIYTDEQPPRGKRKPGRSGTNGNVRRRKDLHAKRHKRGGKEHKQAHMGEGCGKKEASETERAAQKRREKRRRA